ncbi:unnamed protein product [Lepidochelys kempii]
MLTLPLVILRQWFPNWGSQTPEGSPEKFHSWQPEDPGHWRQQVGPACRADGRSPRRSRVKTQESASVSSSPHCGKSKSNDHDGPGKSLTKKRKYDYDYIKYGFTCIGDQERPKPLCVICGDVLANSSLKPSLLWRHLETRNPAQLDKPVDFFKRKLAERKSDITSFISKASTDNENALEASYCVNYREAKASEAHTIAQSLMVRV